MFDYTHIEPEIKTIGALLKRKDARLFKNLTDSKEFLDFKYPPEGSSDGDQPLPSYTNWHRLKRAYGDPNALRRYSNVTRYKDGDYDGLEIPLNTVLYVPEENIVRNSGLVLVDKNTVNAPTLKAFIAEELDNLFQDPDYKQVIESTSNGLNIISNEGITAYMWVRAAGTEESGGEWLNISAFIHNQQTFVGDNGGNFTLEIAPIVAEYSDGVWGLDNATIKGLETAGFNDTYSATAFINKKSKDLLERNKFFFHTAIAVNDLVYIKFEDLATDKKIKSIGGDFKLSGEEVARHSWDMIGMVDTVPQVVNSVDNNILIRITGRDLIKALIEDECVFFPEEYATSIFADMGESKDGKLVRRLAGRLIDMSTYVETSIEFNLKFILNQLSNTGYVSNKAFSGYAKGIRSKINRRLFNFSEVTEFGALGRNNQEDDWPVGEVEADGIWKIIKLVVDESIRSRRVVDSSIFSSQGSLLNFVRKVCQAPLVEFISDTYGKQFYLTARKPPFDKEALISLVYDVSVDKSKPEGYGKVTPTYNKPSVPSQDPELTQAVKGSDPNAIVVTAKRREFPPEYSLSSLTISINEGEVFNENLAYETRVYSWYSYLPKGMLNGIQNDMPWAFLKAVKFDEYVDVWGSKPLQVVSNYSQFHDYAEAALADSKIQYETQALQDLKFLVESNAYLPFTRKGQITIHGDRRFKRGMFCHYLPTNEVFYIDSVEQRRDVSIGNVDRITTLNVSRGMVEPYIRGGLGGISYFSIIDAEAPDIYKTGEANKILSKWKVNTDVFNFFLNRRQWADTQIIGRERLNQLSSKQ
jgi:hypothetical protein